MTFFLPSRKAGSRLPQMAERMNQTVVPEYFEASRTDSPLGLSALAVCITATGISHDEHLTALSL